jgi:glucosamine-phosphate N-acetyltransferase
MLTMNELYQIDKLDKSDYNRGFLKLLEQLTVVEADSISYDDFVKRLEETDMSVYVIRNISSDKVVATGSMYIEKKFIHSLGKVGHIEDVVVDKEYRGMNFGKAMVNRLTEVAEETGCYKVILSCAQKNVKFYENCGYSKKELQMVKYFD